MGYDKPPAILIQKCPQGLLPYGIHSGPMLDDLLIGQVMTATPRKGRTQERNGAYWAGLHTAIKATDAWSRPTQLHDSLKRLCGYVEHYYDPLTGKEDIRVQSTSFDKMGESEFALFFRLAQHRFIGAMGFDAWARGE